MYSLKRSVPVNEPRKSFLSRHDVWVGLVMKANNALPYVPQMQKCAVVERGEGWLIRDILLNNVPLREKVTFEPERRVTFERVAGTELGRIENVLEEDAAGVLTLTFAFSLTKQGIASGSPEESAHFAPMEGAYMGAVASTLAAVRKMADDQGRQAVPPESPIDVSGDNSWIYEYYRVADRLNMESFLAQHTDDARLTFANYPTVHGKAAMAESISGLWSRITAMSHSIKGAWSLHDGQVGIVEAQVMYTRKDDSVCLINTSTVLRRRQRKISDLRIYCDVSPL